MAVPTRHRRTFILGSAGALALFAGCLADPEERSAADSDSSASRNADRTDETGDDDLSYETSRYQFPESSTDPDATLLVDRDDATDWLADRDLEGDSLGAFVDETAFADATLIALEAAAPNACYELVLAEIGVPERANTAEDEATGDDEATDESNGESDDGESLTLEATVRDESDETEVCTQALTTVGLLVRATVDAEPVTELSARVVDEEGDDHEISAAVETATTDAPAE